MTEKLTTKDKRFKLPVWYKPVLIMLVIAALSGYLLFSGWGKYLQAFITCGGKQPYIASNFLVKTYIQPGDTNYSVPVSPFAIGFSGYYCTEADIKSAGFLSPDY